MKLSSKSTLTVYSQGRDSNLSNQNIGTGGLITKRDTPCTVWLFLWINRVVYESRGTHLIHTENVRESVANG